jgi:hypothetical protein
LNPNQKNKKKSVFKNTNKKWIFVYKNTESEFTNPTTGRIFVIHSGLVTINNPRNEVIPRDFSNESTLFQINESN